VRASTVSVQDARRDELRGAPRPRETGRQKKREPAGPAETIADPTTSSLYVQSVEKAMTVLTDILARTNLVAYTSATVFQPRKIKERIEAIRKQGYTHTEEEYFDRRRHHELVRPRWHADRDEKRFADLVISTASAISSRRRAD
jgi:hypothetical protein